MSDRDTEPDKNMLGNFVRETLLAGKPMPVTVESNEAVITIGDERCGLIIRLRHLGIDRWHMEFRPVTPKTPLPPYALTVETSQQTTRMRYGVESAT